MRQSARHGPADGRVEHRRTPALGLPALVVVAALGAGCAGAPGTQVPVADPEAAPTTTGPSTTPPAGSTTPSPTAPPHDPEDTAAMQIQITIGDQQLGATLRDTAAARDLVAQLPVTVDMVDHGGVEKTGRLPSPLSTDQEPEGADPDVGAVGYYAPGQDLVLYYGDQSYFPGIVVLGRLDDGAAPRLAELDGGLTVTVRAR